MDRPVPHRSFLAQARKPVTADYRIIGAEESPYSMKVRSYLRFKALPHRWLTRLQAPELYRQFARVPLLPLVVTPEGKGLQDSTLIIEQIEAVQPDPSIHPRNAALDFLSFLLEEFADEWGNKWVVHYRWAREVDQLACARRLAETTGPRDNPRALEIATAQIREKMVDRIWFTGSSPGIARQIEDSFKDTLALLEPHLEKRPYLFGHRPALADFALWGQLANACLDPTPRGIIETQAPNTLGWIDRMNNPVAQGEYEPWESLTATLGALVRDQVAGLFLPWSEANAKAISEQTGMFCVALHSGTWEQKPQPHASHSLEALHSRFRFIADDAELQGVLSETGCLGFFS